MVDEAGVGDEEAVVKGTEGAVDLSGTSGVKDAMPVSAVGACPEERRRVQPRVMMSSRA